MFAPSGEQMKVSDFVHGTKRSNWRSFTRERRSLSLSELTNFIPDDTDIEVWYLMQDKKRIDVQKNRKDTQIGQSTDIQSIKKDVVAKFLSNNFKPILMKLKEDVDKAKQYIEQASGMSSNDMMDKAFKGEYKDNLDNKAIMVKAQEYMKLVTQYSYMLSKISDLVEKGKIKDKRL
jgi:hypothetical protein